MRKVRRLTAMLGVASAFGCVGSLILVACDGEDTVVTPEPDGSLPDTGKPDVVTVDGSKDSANDVQGDVQADAPIDGGGTDGAPEAAVDLPESFSSAICDRIASCCLSTDAGVIDKTACQAQWRNGWELSTQDLRVLRSDGGAGDKNLVYDNAAAAQCIALVSNFSCGTITAADYKAMTQACYAAVYGKLAVGATGCTASLECEKTAFCDKTDAGGGGGGICRALVATGGPCAPFGNEACSYRSTGAYCDPIDNNGVPDSGAVCTPTFADGITCRFTSTHFNKECTSGLCGDGTCGTGGVLIYPPSPGDPGFCAAYRDGG